LSDVACEQPATASLRFGQKHRVVTGVTWVGDGTTPAGLRLVKSRSFPTGVIVANYAPDGAVRTGSFALAEPTEAEMERRRKLR
jgi:hypothetical protein